MYLQLENDSRDVKCLLETKTSSDSGLHASIATIRNDYRSRGNMSDFTFVGACILHYDPVSKKKSSKDHNNKHPSIVDIQIAASLTFEKTRMCPRFHNPGELIKL